MRAFLPALSALTIAVGPAWAQCPQEQAQYGNSQASAELRFDPQVRSDDGVYHRFEIVFPENDVRMQGVVLPAEGLPRPWAMVMHNCPEGDATGEEIAACTVWEGVIYAIDGKGEVAYLEGAGGGGEAAKVVLLPDFGNSVTLSPAWGDRGLSAAPEDDFQLKGCQP